MMKKLHIYRTVSNKKFNLIFLFCILTFSVVQAIENNHYDISVDKNQDSLQISLKLIMSDNYYNRTNFIFGGYCNIHNLQVDGKSVRYEHSNDTLRIFSPNIRFLTIDYSIPIDIVTVSGAIILRREHNWYPHTNDELYSSNITISDSGSYIIASGTESSQDSFKSEVSNELHLFCLAKDSFDVKEIENLKFYYKKNRKEYTPEFYNEFVNSYNYYTSFFDDNLQNQSIHIVEISDPNFRIAQSLKGCIIFGSFFYKIYEMVPDFSWISHEVAHQWWGNTLLFMKNQNNRMFLEESITEYLKGMYIRNTKEIEKYNLLIDSYKNNFNSIDRNICFKEINNVRDLNESIMIYSYAPFLFNNLSDLDKLDLDNELKQMYHKYKGIQISFADFLNSFHNDDIKKKVYSITNECFN